jgi:hypothetical protein
MFRKILIKIFSLPVSFVKEAFHLMHYFAFKRKWKYSEIIDFCILGWYIGSLILPASY